MVTTVLVIALAIPISLTPLMKRRLTAALEERFGGQVAVDSLSITILPWPRLDGRGLVIRRDGRTDVPPLIQIASFSTSAGVFGLLRRPVRVGRVALEGLEINVPPGGLDINGDNDKDKTGERPKPPKTSPLIVGTLTSERAVLRILRRTPGKQPRLFEIHQLDMRGVGANEPWPFRARLTNPKPPGLIDVDGTFGPWNPAEPARTALAASYTFQNADLGIFDDIQGILSSSGQFAGVLERIEVMGRTSVPGFALTDVGNQVPLETQFHSIVDGTNGNTLLEPVDALLGTTKIHTSGGVVEIEGQKGRTITLDVVMTEAALEDVLRLAVKGDRPPLTGGLKLRASLLIPPGDRKAMDKLQLDGTFEVATARFTKATLQAKVDAFSTKASGKQDETPDPVVSNFNGRFRMRDGVIHLSNVTFAMPGARVNVSGHYTLRTQALDFQGTVRLDAKLSSLTTGVRSFLLRAVDGLFRHDGITVVPISVGGTASQPAVTLDVKKALKGD